MNASHLSPLRQLALACSCVALLSAPTLLHAADDDSSAAIAADPGTEVSDLLPRHDFLHPNGDFLGIKPLDIPALSGFSIGAGVGAFNTDYSDSVNDGSVTMIDDRDTGTAFNFVLGYRITDYISLEGGFSTTDDVDFAAVSDGTGASWSAGPVSADYEADMWTVDLVGKYPIAPKWWLLARAGYLHWETTETFNESGVISIDSESGSSARVGIGLEYDIGLEDYFKYRFELGYQHIGGNDDLDVVTGAIGLVFELP